ncbi:hypothetical protein [Methyloceanibacter sp.]|uniref:hypothetical protein n=1 Tax=Methyloceanibacter sp. TaxID=1965321 RepID=UPI002CAE3C03|nr:hypothetical protein [Methyloceanibacter sp.]HML92331.1 hypothetical protein [Methyloceanibacter sp.]
MHGTNLSRWTMSYFVVALGALLLGEILMAAGYGFPSAPIRAPETLVLVHVVAIGWLSLLLCGALFQFVPVLIARPLYSDSLPLPTLLFIVAGLAGLVLGFLQRAGTIDSGVPLLPYAAASLTIGFALALWNLGRTLCTVRPLALPARFVAVALVCLAATVALGVVFSLVLGLNIRHGALLKVAGQGLPLHVVAGIGGWLTFAAIGVSYRLLAMFMLSPERDGRRTQAVLWLGTAALAIAILGGLAALLFDKGLHLALLAGGVLGLAALGLYGMDVLHLYRARKRRVIELNSRMAALALISLAAAAIMAVVLIGLGQLSERIGAVVFLLVFGWLSGLGLSQLYKIVAFLTWLECYGPVLGKTATPRVQDLVDEARARKWFVLYYLSVWAATAFLLAPHLLGFRLAVAAMMAATLGLAVHFARSRLLSQVSAQSGLPEGARRPHLLVSIPRPS